MNSKSLLKALLILALPLAEILALRLYLHQGLGLRIGFPGFTEYELLFPAPLGFFAFIIALEQAEKLKLAFQSRMLGLHSVLLIGFLFLNQFYQAAAESLGAFLPAAWWGLFIALVGSAFFVWVQPKRVFANPHFWAIGPSLVMVFSLVLYMKFGAPLWAFALKKMEWAIRGVLSLSGNEVIQVTAMRKYLRVHHPLQTVFVGQGCGGFDGILFFLCAFSIFAPINWGLLKKRTWFITLVTGVGFFLTLNILRILSLFTLAIVAIRALGKEAGWNLALGIFHTHAGYLLYAVGVVLFFNTIKAIAQTQQEKLTKTSVEFFGIHRLRKEQNQP